MSSQAFDETLVDFYSLHWTRVAKMFATVIPALVPARTGATNRVLDLGCGGGEVLEAMAKHGYLGTGIDLSEPLLGRAHERLKDTIAAGRVTLLHGDMSRIPLPSDQQYTLVTSIFWVFNYVPDATLQATLANVCAHLEPNAVLLFHLRSRGQFEALDGEVTVRREYGGRITRRTMRLPAPQNTPENTADYFAFYDGSYRDAEGRLQSLDYRVRMYAHSIPALCRSLATHGVPHAIALDVAAPAETRTGTPGARLSIRPVGIDAADDDARDVVLLASPDPAVLQELGTRLASLW